jgi:hypothetical protein
MHDIKARRAVLDHVVENWIEETDGTALSNKEHYSKQQQSLPDRGLVEQQTSFVDQGEDSMTAISVKQKGIPQLAQTYTSNKSEVGDRLNSRSKHGTATTSSYPAMMGVLALSHKE